MSETTDSLQAEEQQVFERERELEEHEHEVQQQEQGLIDMERSYTKRVKALVSLLSYVGNQERNLLKRAETIGPAARDLVQETIETVDEAAVLDELDFGLEDLRQTMLERRLDLVDVRMALVEDRESLFEERAEKLENAETRIAELEESLLQRETDIATVLRKLIIGAAELTDADDMGTADTVAAMPVATHSVRETDSIGRESLKVESGTAEARKDVPAEDSGEADDDGSIKVIDEPSDQPTPDDVDTVDEESEEDGEAAEEAPEEAPEDEAAEEDEDTSSDDVGSVQFNVEADFNTDAGHTFFNYEDDEDELPGLFIATKNLLKEDREVSVLLRIGETSAELSGIVAWRRMEADDEGAAGMGIEITELGEGAPQAIRGWLDENTPITV